MIILRDVSGVVTLNSSVYREEGSINVELLMLNVELGET
jgi:hypothetical protein